MNALFIAKGSLVPHPLPSPSCPPVSHFSTAWDMWWIRGAAVRAKLSARELQAGEKFRQSVDDNLQIQCKPCGLFLAMATAYCRAAWLPWGKDTASGLFWKIQGWKPPELSWSELLGLCFIWVCASWEGKNTRSFFLHAQRDFVSTICTAQVLSFLLAVTQSRPRHFKPSPLRHPGRDCPTSSWKFILGVAKLSPSNSLPFSLASFTILHSFHPWLLKLLSSSSRFCLVLLFSCRAFAYAFSHALKYSVSLSQDPLFCHSKLGLGLE